MRHGTYQVSEKESELFLGILLRKRKLLLDENPIKPGFICRRQLLLINMYVAVTTLQIKRPCVFCSKMDYFKRQQGASMCSSPAWRAFQLRILLGHYNPWKVPDHWTHFNLNTSLTPSLQQLDNSSDVHVWRDSSGPWKHLCLDYVWMMPQKLHGPYSKSSQHQFLKELEQRFTPVMTTVVLSNKY